MNTLSQLNSSEIAPLRRRWKQAGGDKAGADLRDQAAYLGLDPHGPHRLASPFGETADGLVDLRGFETGRLGLELVNLRVSGIDLSFAHGAIGASESELTNVRLDGATLTKQPRFTRSLEACSFRETKFDRVTLGPRVIACDFTGATARRLRSLPGTRFERCAFDATDLRGAQFTDATFVDCTFADAHFSPESTFERCAFIDTAIEFGPARGARSSWDGLGMRDRWEGESATILAQDEVASLAVHAFLVGEEHHVHLDAHGDD